MENLWNQSEYETILDVWGMWIELTAWQIFFPYQMALKTAKTLFFYLLGFTILNDVYHSRPLWFKIITLTIQSDADDRPNSTDREGAS